MVRQHAEPYLWLLFSVGGVLSAMLMPSLLLLFGVAFPLGWVRPPTHEHMLAVLGGPLVQLVLLGCVCCRCSTRRIASATRCMMPCGSRTR